VVHQESGGLLLQLDRERIGRLVHDRYLIDLELAPARGADLLPKPAGDDEGRLAGEAFGPGEEVGLFGLGDHPLDRPRPVADLQEQDLPARALVVQPTAERDPLSDVIPRLIDRYPLHRSPPRLNLKRD